MPLSPFALLDRRFAPAPDPARIGWIGGRQYAHRGLHGVEVPENSLSAFSAAIARGMGIECDVQRTADGQAMVFHDWELDRLTAESGPVVARNAAQLGAIRLAGSEETIPTLSALLDLVAGQVPLLIEIKSRADTRVPVVCLAVRRALEGYLGPHAVMSFDPRVGKWFRTHSPLTVRGLIITEENDHTLIGRLRRRLWLWNASPDFLAYDVRDLPSRFAAAQRKRGLPVVTWTVRNAELRERAALHADAPIAEGAGVA